MKIIVKFHNTDVLTAMGAASYIKSRIDSWHQDFHIFDIKFYESSEDCWCYEVQAENTLMNGNYILRHFESIAQELVKLFECTNHTVIFEE